MILRGSEKITVNLIADPATTAVAEKVEFSVLHQEKTFLIISKPQGVLSHPSASHHTKTLLNGLLYK